MSGVEEQCTPGRCNVGSVYVTEYHDHARDANDDVTEEMSKIDLAEVEADISTFIDHLNCNR